MMPDRLGHGGVLTVWEPDQSSRSTHLPTSYRYVLLAVAHDLPASGLCRFISLSRLKIDPIETFLRHLESGREPSAKVNDTRTPGSASYLRDTAPGLPSPTDTTHDNDSGQNLNFWRQRMVIDKNTHA